MKPRKITLLGPEGTNLYIFFQFLTFNFISWFNLFLISKDFSFSLSNIVFRQIIFSILGIVVFFIFTYISIQNIMNLSHILMISSTFLLIGVLFTEESLGAKRRYDLGLFDFQPSEFTKVVFVIFLAKIFTDNSKSFSSFFLIGLNIVLIFLQPDLGTTFILLLLLFLYFYISDAKLLNLILVLIISFFLFLGLLELNVVSQFQVERITDFYSSSQDFSQSQARLQISLGGMTGQSVTDNLSVFVPVQTTDFIFSAFSKNFGFLGCLVLFMLWFFFAIRIRLLIKRSNLIFEKYLLSGFLILIFIQIFINVFTVLGLIPLTGDPFPLLSLGGSSIIAVSSVFGVINRSFIENNLTI